MSLSLLIPYVRNKLQGLGYTEHTDEFDGDNIPATVMDKTFKLNPGSLSAQRASSKDYLWTYPLEIEIFFRGYNYPSAAVDGAFVEVEKIMDEVFDIADRYSQSGIRDIYPTGVSFEPFSSDNDSIVRVKIDMSAQINIYNSKDCL